MTFKIEDFTSSFFFYTLFNEVDFDRKEVIMFTKIMFAIAMVSSMISAPSGEIIYKGTDPVCEQSRVYVIKNGIDDYYIGEIGSKEYVKNYGEGTYKAVEAYAQCDAEAALHVIMHCEDK